MKREILFRAKRTDNEEWIEGFLDYNPFLTSFKIHVVDYVSPTYQDPGGDVYSVRFEVDPGTIGQYTGFNWKGKKLFDGDILRLEEDTDEGTEISYLVIQWIKEWGLWATLFIGEYKGYQDQGTEALDEFIMWNYTIKSIYTGNYFLCGNIHDNPELLDK